jgi:hypothetical protein
MHQTFRQGNRTVTIVGCVTGEQTQQLGAEGSHAAKRWLESTTRAHVQWENPGKVSSNKLTFSWARQTGRKHLDFSFDLGGMLEGADDYNHSREGEQFFAEVKKYSNSSDQSNLYKEFLAKCFSARHLEPRRADVFMWITWSPFGTTSWATIHSKEKIVSAVIAERARALGIEDEAEARQRMDTPEMQEIVEYLSDSIWIIVLCEQQEQYLTLSSSNRSILIANQIKEA